MTIKQMAFRSGLLIFVLALCLAPATVFSAQKPYGNGMMCTYYQSWSTVQNEYIYKVTCCDSNCTSACCPCQWRCDKRTDGSYLCKESFDKYPVNVHTSLNDMCKKTCESINVCKQK